MGTFAQPKFAVQNHQWKTMIKLRCLLAWITDFSPPSDWRMEFSQSAPVFKHTSLDTKATARNYTVVLQTKHVLVPFCCCRNNVQKRLGYVQFEAWVRTYVYAVYFAACLSGRDYLAKSERSSK